MRLEDFKSIKEFYYSPAFFLWRITRSDEEIHPCFNCPGIQEDFERRIDKDEDVCAYDDFQSFIEDIREICDNSWCAKYGGKSWMVRDANHCGGR